MSLNLNSCRGRYIASRLALCYTISYRSAARGFNILFSSSDTCTGRMRKSRRRRPRQGFCRSHAVRNAAKERLSRSKLVRRSLARSKLFTYKEYICEPLDLVRYVRSIRLESSVRCAVGTTHWLDSVGQSS